ncbi:MAG: hypothetical protein GTO62_04940, partial [Planctomycetales bacterium]|nr:hypothetical protein [Planctomycetales bacterium]
GIGPGAGGIPPTWPSGEGKRVFAYLKPFPALPKLLAMLNQLGCPAIVYGDAIPGAVRQRYRSETLQFEDQRLDLGLV